MNELPLHKQLVHHQFCGICDKVSDPNILRQMLKDLHYLHLSHAHTANLLLLDKLAGDIKNDRSKNDH